MTFGFCNAEVTGELETAPSWHGGRRGKLEVRGEERMGGGQGARINRHISKEDTGASGKGEGKAPRKSYPFGGWGGDGKTSPSGPPEHFPGKKADELRGR